MYIRVFWPLITLDPLEVFVNILDFACLGSTHAAYRKDMHTQFYQTGLPSL
jgi:hypothetical protein